MAETKKAKAAKRAKPKRARAAKETKGPGARKAAPKAKRMVAAKAAPRRRVASSSSSGFDVTKLIDHPLVADLLAVGAMAAVAAIADHHVKTRTGEAESGSSKAVKAAGKAAAAAIGKRLLTEVKAVKAASQPKEKARRGSR